MSEACSNPMCWHPLPDHGRYGCELCECEWKNGHRPADVETEETS